VEVEFIAQTLQLIHAARHPSVLDTNTHAALGRLMEAGLLAQPAGQALREANALYHRLTQVLRLCVTGAYDPAKSPAALNRLVASAAAAPDTATAEALLTETQTRVAILFDDLVGPVS
jgi:glutamate-ammonia-ligase adenylyltransferase